MIRSWRGVCLAVGCALLAWAAWCALPRADREQGSSGPLRVVILDASLGTTRRRPGWELWARRQVQREARAARAAGQAFDLIVYGAEVRRVAGGREAQNFLDLLAGRAGRTLALGLEGRAALGSELDAALLAAQDELLGAGSSAQLTLVAAADYSGPDPARRLARMERAGVLIEWRQPEPARVPDLALMDVRLPSAPAVGEPLSVRIDLALDGAGALVANPAPGAETEIIISISHEFAGASREFEVRVAAAERSRGSGGYGRFSERVDLGPTPAGRSLVRVRARLVGQGVPAGEDALPENDQLSGQVRAGPARLVALVCAPEGIAAARAWIGSDPHRWPGLQWIVTTPPELFSLAGEIDVLVSLNLPAADLPRDLVMGLLAQGGGWLHAGGWPLLLDLPDDPSPRADGLLAEALPLARTSDDLPPRDVLLLIDGSGSMAGEPFEEVRRAASELVRCLPEGDSLGLRFFSAGLGGRVDLGTGPAARAKTLRTLAGLQLPGGATAILYALEELQRVRQRSEGPAVVLMLTDGRDDNAFDVLERGAAIRAAFAAGGSELRLLATGPKPDFEFLEQLMGSPEGYALAGDLADLGEVFRREVLADQIRSGDLEVELSAVAAGALGAGPVAARRAPAMHPPPQTRYLRTRLRDGASGLWKSVSAGEPLLALQRVAGGLVAAWPTAPVEGWAPGYAGEPQLMAPLLHTLAGERQREPRPRLVATASHLILEGLPESWPLRFEARVRAPARGSSEREFEGARFEFDLGPGAPGSDPRRRRRAPLAGVFEGLEAGTPVTLELRERVGGADLMSLGCEVPRAAECLPGSPRLVPRPWSDPGSLAPAQPPKSVDPGAWRFALAGALALCAAGFGALRSS